MAAQQALEVQRARYEAELIALQARAQQQTPAEQQQQLERTVQAAAKVNLDEASTRAIIDEQLRAAGWEANTQELRFSRGTRPEKGRQLAIAEWPTTEGPADYVLFDGLTAMAVVEAKKVRKDVAASLEQSKRYASGFTASHGAQLAGGPWGKYRVPFLFATNGRPYLKQLETKSGIRFRDARRGANLATALLGWYSPEGLRGLLKQDIERANERLTTEPTDYLELRHYEAVIDGCLIDHEPPINLTTHLAEHGIHWDKGAQVSLFNPETLTQDLVELDDEVNLEIDSFNRTVVTEDFNRVIYAELARHIDPSDPGKTLIFCATDLHADIVVRLLKEAFQTQYGEVDDDAVVKVTGTADKPQKLLRRFKNEQLPSVAVTVDLLTTGVDVPRIVNLVFLRRVRSRILYDQMMGRATRLCPAIEKEVFRIFDAVALYEALEPVTQMKAVVANPKLSFTDLVRELTEVKEEAGRQLALDQLIAKLQRKKQRIKGPALYRFNTTAGMSPDELTRHLKSCGPEQAAQWFAEHPVFLDTLEERSDEQRPLLVSDHQPALDRSEAEVAVPDRQATAHVLPRPAVASRHPDQTRSRQADLCRRADQPQASAQPEEAG